MSSSRPRIGVSSCLIGRPVRFDGGHKRSRFVVDTLARFVDLVPVCPEVELGMGVPRETVRLIASPTGPRMIGNRSATDYTDPLRQLAKERAERLAGLALDGFVLKKDSPTCGIERVRVYRDEGQPPLRTGTGLFAAALRERLPALPLTEEGWLCDPALRASFLERIYTHHRMRTTLLAGQSRADLVAFHSKNKLLYLSHSPARYRTLGREVAHLGERSWSEALSQYSVDAMAALAEPSTAGKHVNVLQHVIGYFKHVFVSWEKRELLTLVDDFRRGLHGLSAPLALIAHYLRRHDVGEWLSMQTYFEPYPKELGTR